MVVGAESSNMFDAKDFMEDARQYNWYVANKGQSPIPSPNSCAVCGYEDARSHGYSGSARKDGGGGFHYYEAPTTLLRLSRMKARRQFNAR
jgi:hypothetical protein